MPIIHNEIEDKGKDDTVISVIVYSQCGQQRPLEEYEEEEEYEEKE